MCISASLGGDHTIVLPILRSLYKLYGPIAVIHFDSHTDTSGTINGPLSPITHGSYFFVAHEEGLLKNDSNIHAGIRSKMNPGKMTVDEYCGFSTISAEDIDDIGLEEVVKRIRERVGDSPVYLTFVPLSSFVPLGLTVTN